MVKSHQSQKCREKAKSDNKPVQCGDEMYAEASFYIGVILWQQGNYESALATLRPLTEDLKLTTVYNALGAIAVQASRAEVRVLAIDGISPSPATLRDGTYPFHRDLALVLRGDASELARAFSDFARSEDVAARLEAAGAVPLRGGGV